MGCTAAGAGATVLAKDAPEMTLPLDKVKVLDFTHLLPGELCSTLLADLGCQVTRIETMKPGLGKKLPPIVKGESLYYWSVHRHKERLRLDLKKPEGLEIAQLLAERADVVLENFRPGVMARLGLGYRRLARRNRSLIYCSISGYGHTASWSQRPGHDLNFVAEAGILNLNRLPGGPPVIPGVLVSDFMAAVYAALGVSAALFERLRTGRGRSIDISMFESALSTMNIIATASLFTGQKPEDRAFTYQSELPNYNVYECADGRYLAVASLEPQFWQTFCERIGRPDLSSGYRGGPDSTLKNEIAGIIRRLPLDEWLRIFDGSDCCVSPVLNLTEALNYPPVKERDMIVQIPHPVLGAVPQLANPAIRHTGPRRKKLAGPGAGGPHEEAVKILRTIGYSRRSIQRLIEAKVIAVD